MTSREELGHPLEKRINLMSKRLVFLLIILVALSAYFSIFSFRSPFKNALFPIIYYKTSREILPNVEPLPNTHEVLLKSGSNINGELISDDNGIYVIHEHIDKNNFTKHTIDHNNTLSITVRPQTFPVSASEIIARRLFPDMKFYRFTNYTLFSNSGFSSIGTTAGILKKLHSDLKKAFPNIISSNAQKNRICVVLFAKSEEYEKLAGSFNPEFVNSIGCYSPDHNLLFINNDLSLRSKLAYPSNTIRHEGTHQIFYISNLHFGWNIDRLWLVEGLAVYSETISLGGRAGQRQTRIIQTLKQNRQIPLKKLVTKNRIGGREMDLFYDQSWAFVYFMMNIHHDGFLKYLSHVKKHPFFSWRKGDVKLLEDFTGRNIKVLEKEFKDYWL